MASQGRMEDATLAQVELEREILEDPTSFGFFQAVRVLERLFPDRGRIGEFAEPREEVARFAANTAISFPASEIQTLDIEPDGQVKLTVNFLGLTGPLGILPLYYSLLVAERARARDRALRDFLDIFNHRFTSLFYRAWEKNRFAIAYERDQSDLVTEHLSDLLGLGTAGVQNLFNVPDESLVFYAGLFGMQGRPAVALERLLEDYFGAPVEVEQFVGGWYPLAADTQCALGDDTSASSQLGVGAIVGDEIWDQQARVRVRIGPLTRRQYDDFLPAGTAHEALRTLTRLFCEGRFDFEVQLVLARDEVPGCVLGSEGEAATPLGWTTWMRSAPFSRDADETVLNL
jgi:type VI secretion system protein ImpH